MATLPSRVTTRRNQARISGHSRRELKVEPDDRAALNILGPSASGKHVRFLGRDQVREFDIPSETDSDSSLEPSPTNSITSEVGVHQPLQGSSQPLAGDGVAPPPPDSRLSIQGSYSRSAPKGRGH
ncbi:hypothetical protein BKA70DRAFT_1241259 [Coprinopsis sp. MPI-PUGE-AT-0042]|nr:hypothetical protein BKA70DRAFT_1241259 [Coprinopsis sp. MPI-PUGE-AT-0042]